MARFKNEQTGVTVSVSDEKADRFTSNGWVRVDDEKSAKPRPTSKKK